MHGRCEAAYELIIVVGIQNIVLAIVLAVRHQIDRREPFCEIIPRGLTLRAGAISIAAPVEIDIGEITAILPIALVDQAAEACAVRAGLRPEHAMRRLLLRGPGAHAAGLERAPF